jgi:hypothetical protein
MRIKPREPRAPFAGLDSVCKICCAEKWFGDLRLAVASNEDRPTCPHLLFTNTRIAHKPHSEPKKLIVLTVLKPPGVILPNDKYVRKHRTFNQSRRLPLRIIIDQASHDLCESSSQSPFINSLE